MLRARVLTAILLLAVLLPVMFFAPASWLGVLFAAVVAAAAWEWARLLGLAGAAALAYALVSLLVLAGGLALTHGVAQPLWIGAVAFWIGYVPWALFTGVRRLRVPEQAGLLLAGLLVLPACWFAVVAARERGIVYLLSLLVLVWAADIGAYFAGKAFGRRKLAARISPGKTIEGAIGGLALALAVSVLLAGLPQPTVFALAAQRHGAIGAVAMLSALVAVSIVGDLFESVLKRQAGVKDSSHLLPGHGGVLDRIDALLPTLPLAMLFI